MSSCLLTFICVGPVKLSKDKRLRKKAVAQVRKYVAYVEAVDVARNDNKEPPAPPRGFNKYNGDDSDDYRFMLGLDPEKVVDELFQLWSGKDLPSDVNTRTYRPWSSAVTHKILVAGDSSWGDAPDGEGYRICQQSSCFGLFDLYGIR